jgi:hypothetical protein
LDERKSTEEPQKKISGAPSGKAADTPHSASNEVEAQLDTLARTPASRSSIDRFRRGSNHVGVMKSALRRTANSRLEHVIARLPPLFQAIKNDGRRSDRRR